MAVTWLLGSEWVKDSVCNEVLLSYSIQCINVTMLQLLYKGSAVKLLDTMYQGYHVAITM